MIFFKFNLDDLDKANHLNKSYLSINYYVCMSQYYKLEVTTPCGGLIRASLECFVHHPKKILLGQNKY